MEQNKGEENPMMLTIKRRRAEGRHFIELEVTPMTPAADAMLGEFQAQLRSFEKRWREMAKAYEGETAGPKRASASKKEARPKRPR
jgi:hypothetical protein